MSPTWTRLAALWRHISRRQPPELEPAEAYRRWAGHYGREPNELQRLEAGARASLLPDLTGRLVLDVGCGTGRATGLAFDLGARSCVGADFTLGMLTGPRTRPGDSRLAARVEALPFRAHSFDTVISALLLGHVADLARAIGEMARVLAPGGHLVITGFHPLAARRGWRRTFHDRTESRTFSIRHFPHRTCDYLEALAAAGLRLQEMEQPRWRGRPVILALRARKTALENPPSQARGGS